MKKLIIVGRHDIDAYKDTLEELYDVIERVNMTFEDAADVYKFMADNRGATILFQMSFPQLTLAMPALFNNGFEFGLVVSKPGPRPPSQVVEVPTLVPELARKWIEILNPRAELVEVDDHLAVKLATPMTFEFDHIEWF